jgi:hypothetical protein
LGLVGIQSREKHTSEPLKFGMPPALLGSFGERFRFPYRLKSFGGTLREVQGFSL